MDLQLTGKRAVATGASRGIGYSVAEALAQRAPRSFWWPGIRLPWTLPAPGHDR